MEVNITNNRFQLGSTIANTQFLLKNSAFLLLTETVIGQDQIKRVESPVIQLYPLQVVILKV